MSAQNEIRKGLTFLVWVYSKRVSNVSKESPSHSKYDFDDFYKSPFTNT